MRSETKEKLVVACMAMRAMGPQAWDEFMKVMLEVTADAARDCVAAPTEALQKMQGAAQAMEQITKTLVTAPTLFENRRKAVDGAVPPTHRGGQVRPEAPAGRSRFSG